ncbi:hypothetical protein L602_003700000270 [Cupriavidus gilardii J11]|uniref:Uncharacterized protein n=1 Tax=Cupriavidus gilardii J11 TaxID=936133 RepID=A0A562BB54_9BURK|nr:hypothetical protein L602_003700000270 [Cupriavidus gilardii J11]
MATVLAIALADMATELLSRLRYRGRRPLLWLWLALCLLTAQYAGLVHRIQHGGMAGLPQIGVTAPLAADDHAPDAQRKAFHSCVLFDGAAAGDLSCGELAMPGLSHGMPFLPAGISWRWPHLPAQRGFLSRAPPSRFALN